jgi:hypothetical protein
VHQHVGALSGTPVARQVSSIRVRLGLGGATLIDYSSRMLKPTITTLTPIVTATSVFEVFDYPQRCSGVLGHINCLAEDGEWHCQLPHGHDGVCLAPDGTTW